MMRRYDNTFRLLILATAPLFVEAGSVLAASPPRFDAAGVRWAASHTSRKGFSAPEDTARGRTPGDSLKPDPIRGSKRSRDLAIPALTAALVPIVRPADRVEGSSGAATLTLTTPPPDAAARGRLSAAARVGRAPPTVAGVPIPSNVAGTDATAAAPAGTAAAKGTTAAAAVASPAPAPAVSPSATAPAAAPAAVLGKPVTGFQPDAPRAAAANLAGASFVRDQLGSARVKHARAAADAPLRAAFVKAGLGYPARVYFRAFKREHQLEVWGGRPDGSFALVKTYSICSLGGSTLGPKLRRGDEQVPEGFYHLVEFNPTSEYHLSLRLDYPNAADLSRGVTQRAGNLGGDIYLHGGCKSAGCLPLTDAGIEEIYWLSVQARAGGQKDIPIDIFPARLDGEHWTQLTSAFSGRKDLLTFWADLKVAYDAFERWHRLPDVSIDGAGRYRIALLGR